jgi:hypothetical protein
MSATEQHPDDDHIDFAALMDEVDASLDADAALAEAAENRCFFVDVAEVDALVEQTLSPVESGSSSQDEFVLDQQAA